jgi:3-hydroxybutyryl-CoA dehydrogenase
MAKIKTICVCGAGTMGSGIAQVAAQAGYAIILFDINEAMLQRAKQAIEKNLQRLVEKNQLKIDESAAILQRISFTTELTQCKADVVIEAIAEIAAIKTNLYNQLAEINTAATLFASNTSSLSITQLQQQIPHPQRMAGMHFFNPAPLMKLVEIVKGQQTSDDTITTLLALAESFGKTPVTCTDSPGFIVNRVARPYYLEAMRLASAGVASIEDVDAIMEATGFKMGPFKLMDLIGLDVNYAVSQLVYDALDKPERLQPSPLQKQKIDEGHLGKKTGEGFYEY